MFEAFQQSPIMLLAQVCKKFKMTPIQVAILAAAHTAGGPIEFSALIPAVGVSAATVSRDVEKFVNLKLMVRSGVDGNRRKVGVALTKAGQTFFNKHIPPSIYSAA